MVKRSRDQSQDAPQPLELVDDGAAGLRLPGPDLLQELLAGPSRGGPAPGAPSSAARPPSGSAMPAWSVPGCHSTSLPRIRSNRHRMSCSVLLSAWPMCSEPVTFGGGMTMAIGRRRPRALRPPGAERACVLSQAGINAAFDLGRLVSLVDHGLFRIYWRCWRARSPPPS